MKQTFLLLGSFLILAGNVSAQSIEKDTTLANTYFEKACVLKDSSQVDSAIAYFQKASLLFEKHQLWRKYLISQNKQAICYQDKWQLNEAINTIKPAMVKSIPYTGVNDSIVADAYHTLGIQYYYQSKLDSVLKYFQKTLSIRKNIFGEKHTDVADSYSKIGVIYGAKSQYEKALKYHQKALKMQLELTGENHPDVASSYGNIAIIYLYSTEYNEALKYYRKSLDIYLKLFGEQHVEVARSYGNIGVIYDEKSDYNKALDYFQKALEIRLKLLGEKHIDVADSYHNIGVVYDNKHEYKKALQYYKKSLDIFLELFGEKHLAVADSYNNIGGVYSQQLQYNKALEYHKKALNTRLELLGERHIYILMSYVNIGAEYKNQSKFQKAMEFFNKALEINKELYGETNKYVADLYSNIGAIYDEKAQYDTALEYYKRSLDISIKLLSGNHSKVATAYKNIGGVFADEFKYNKALKYFHLSIYANLPGYNDSITLIKVPPIRNYIDHSELLKSLQSKAQIFADTAKDISEIGDFSNLQRMQIALRHYQAADTLVSKARQDITTRSDKLALGESANAVYTEAVELCHAISGIWPNDSAEHYKEQAFNFSEKNKSSVLLEALAGAEAMQFSGIPDSLLEKEHDLQINIALYKKILAEQPDSAKEARFNDKLFKANRSYDSLMAVFEKQYPKYHELKYGQNLASVEQLQQILDKKTAIISYIESDSMLTVFEITKNNFDIHKTPKISGYEDMLMLMRANINSHRGDSKIYASAASKLYKQLFPFPIHKNIKNLLIIPSGSMSLVPFEALLTGKYNGADDDYAAYPYLLKKYNISYTYSANLFYRTFPKENTKKVEVTPLNDWLAFAPVFDDEKTGGATLRTREMLAKLESNTADSNLTRGTMLTGEYITPLPGTESEVKSIFQKFEEKGKKATVQLNENASEEYVKSGVLKDYKYIHFASHGIVNTRKPELSGIILAQDSTSKEDGILHTGEMYNLELNADLTVLSACETGLGEIKKGEGLIGLSRALLYAGSKNIIVSLWKVADNSTKQLMVDFYSNLLENESNTNYSESLRKAKLKMISEGKYACPYFWSPFILVGR